MKHFLFFLIASILIWGCAGQQLDRTPLPPQEVKITIESVGENKAAVNVKSGDKIHKSMEVQNPEMKLSQLSAISGGKLFIKIFSGLSVADVTRAWSDLIYIENETDIKTVVVFIDSPGGDAFAGLALADQIERFKKRGFYFIAEATGIVASAAVPVFAVCNETHATQATIFMVHEAALWKWPGRETASQIRSQTALMDLLQKLYLNKLVENSNLDFDQWVVLEAKTSWFDVHKAVKIGILDFID